jgi:hypothetical protein
MRDDPRTLAREEEEDEAAEQKEMLEDLITAVKCLLKNGEKKAAISLIEKILPD